MSIGNIDIVNYALYMDPAGTHILAGPFYVFINHDYTKIRAIRYSSKKECFSLQCLDHYTAVTYKDVVKPLIYVMEIHGIHKVNSGSLKDKPLSELITEFT